MEAPIIVFVISTVALLLVVLVMTYESRRGHRFLGGVRSHLDFWLLKTRHLYNVRLRAWGRYFLRQIGHYLLHSFLRGAIHSLGRIENRLKTLLRSNKAIAKRSDRERTHMNTLDEIALHKMEIALTEEEKRIRKRQSLEG